MTNYPTDRRVVFKFNEIWPTRNRWNYVLLTWPIFGWSLALSWIIKCKRPLRRPFSYALFMATVNNY